MILPDPAMVENPVAHCVGDPLIPAAELGKDGAYAKPLGDWWNHVEATKVWSPVHGWRIILSMLWFIKDNLQQTIVFSGVEWCCMGLLKNIVTFCWLGFPTIGNDTKKISSYYWKNQVEHINQARHVSIGAYPFPIEYSYMEKKQCLIYINEQFSIATLVYWMIVDHQLVDCEVAHKTNHNWEWFAQKQAWVVVSTCQKGSQLGIIIPFCTYLFTDIHVNKTHTHIYIYIYILCMYAYVKMYAYACMCIFNNISLFILLLLVLFLILLYTYIYICNMYVCVTPRSIGSPPLASAWCSFFISCAPHPDPQCSMYGICRHIWFILGVNVGTVDLPATMKHMGIEGIRQNWYAQISCANIREKWTE